ncbi:unnamed protein product [Rotaria magnacalcarata]|uniref:Uncharacterized protein n=1 Tax=Rotaria magnacalcarata TaxID=392030 RepID=A0A815RHH2_9BILA|nr:unnamed protein product [Rotaria magnacalcarata]
MHPSRRHHFLNVARSMNNYVIASSHHYYQRQYYRSMQDRVNYLTMHRRPALADVGLSGLFAYGLNYIGMPPSVVNFGYRVGYFFDTWFQSVNIVLRFFVFVLNQIFKQALPI